MHDIGWNMLCCFRWTVPFCYIMQGENKATMGEVIGVDDVPQRGVGGVHHLICDGPDAVPSSQEFYPKRYL